MSATNEVLAEQYKALHRRPTAFAGFQTVRHSESIGRLVKETGAKRLLDYGCGKGMQYSVHTEHAKWGVERPVCYDPYYTPFKRRPIGKFDGVLCTDVMEHVPEEDVQSVLEELAGYTKEGGFVFLSISTVKAKKTLPDGRNAHLTVKEPSWWDAELAKALAGIKYEVVYVAD